MTASGPRTTSWIELSETALRSNVTFLRKVLGSSPTLCSVVKGNAYGHSIRAFVPMAERCGIKQFAVFSAEEACDVLAARRKKSSVMIMGSVAAQDLPWAIENEISFFVFDLSRLDATIRVARKLGKTARVHLEVETGLYRTGFHEKGLKAALTRFRNHPDLLQLEGVCTHLCGAESSANYHRIQEQLDIFRRRLPLFRESGFADPVEHIACSAAIFNHPESIRDLVRVGIAQYGFWPSEETRMTFLHRSGKRPRPGDCQLKRVMAWKSRVMNIKTAPAGAFIGYGHSFQALRNMRLATVPVGYAQGFPRAQSDVGQVLIHGRRCRVVGTVNMNMITVDITELESPKPGDEVVLIGQQGDGEISVGAFGERTHNLNYEVLVRISPEIPRIVVA